MYARAHTAVRSSGLVLPTSKFWVSVADKVWQKISGPVYSTVNLLVAHPVSDFLVAEQAENGNARST